ncbi:MAG: DedA family protein [Candidatus Deferrimicrobiaceae bacterium]
MSIQHFIENYKYWALFLGTILEEETIMILAGLGASQGHLSLAWVFLVGFLGAVAGDQTSFFLGRWKGRKYLADHPSWNPHADRIRRLLDRYNLLILAGFRFPYGIRTTAPVVFGAVGIRAVRFFLANTIGAMIRAVVIGTGGYLFGKALVIIFHDIEHYEHMAIGGIAIILLLIGIHRLLRKNHSSVSGIS